MKFPCLIRFRVEVRYQKGWSHFEKYCTQRNYLPTDLTIVSTAVWSIQHCPSPGSHDIQPLLDGNSHVNEPVPAIVLLTKVYDLVSLKQAHPSPGMTALHISPTHPVGWNRYWPLLRGVCKASSHPYSLHSFLSRLPSFAQPTWQSQQPNVLDQAIQGKGRGHSR